MEATSPPLKTESLARLVRQKRELLQQLATLGERQGELIAGGETVALLQLLGGKQQLIAGLQVVERGLDAFRDDDPDARVWASPAARAACKADADACNALLAQTLSTEQRHEGELAHRRDQLNDRLQQAQSAHVASTAYKPHLRAGRRPAIVETDDSAPLSASLDLTTQD